MKNLHARTRAESNMEVGESEKHFHKKKGSAAVGHVPALSLNINEVDDCLKNCKTQITKYWKKAKLEVEDDEPCKVEKHHLIDMVKTAFGLRMTLMQASEAMIVCFGRDGAVKQSPRFNAIQNSSSPMVQRNRSPMTKRDEKNKGSKQPASEMLHFDINKFAIWLHENL